MDLAQVRGKWAGYYEHGNEVSGYVKGGELLE
jgi:hypothetical protein